jgi:hypothetical protein
MGIPLTLKQAHIKSVGIRIIYLSLFFLGRSGVSEVVPIIQMQTEKISQLDFPALEMAVTRYFHPSNSVKSLGFIAKITTCPILAGFRGIKL